MNDHERITIIANQLANNGKKPTVALIKGKLTSPLPLTKVINALRNWQHEPDNCEFSEPELPIDTEDNKNGPDGVSATDIEKAITLALAPVKAELAEMKALLKQLTKKG